MKTQQPADGAARRPSVGQLTRTTELGGRWSAPGFGVWAPVAGKVLLAIGAAVVLAIVGARAGANPPPTPGPVAAVAAVANIEPASASAANEAAADGGASVLPGEPSAQSSQGAATLADGRIVLNCAGEDDLTKLPGIGPSRAKAILALRERVGRFRAPQDLLRVKGIGRKTLTRILPLVVVNAPAPAPASATPADGGAPHTEARLR